MLWRGSLGIHSERAQTNPGRGRFWEIATPRRVAIRCRGGAETWRPPPISPQVARFSIWRWPRLVTPSLGRASPERRGDHRPRCAAAFPSCPHAAALRGFAAWFFVSLVGSQKPSCCRFARIHRTVYVPQDLGTCHTCTSTPSILTVSCSNFRARALNQQSQWLVHSPPRSAHTPAGRILATDVAPCLGTNPPFRQKRIRPQHRRGRRTGRATQQHSPPLPSCSRSPNLWRRLAAPPIV